MTEAQPETDRSRIERDAQLRAYGRSVGMACSTVRLFTFDFCDRMAEAASALDRPWLREMARDVAAREDEQRRYEARAGDPWA